MHQIMKVIGGLVGGPEGPGLVVHGRYVPIFLRQGGLDGACGSHCLFMVLLMLQLVNPSDVRSLGVGVSNRQLRKVWKLSRTFHFTGMATADARSLLKLLRRHVYTDISEASGDAACRFVVRHVGTGRPVMLGVENKAKRMDHWLLVIGLSGLETGSGFQARAFLALDPDEPHVPGLPWNSTLQIRSSTGSRDKGKLSALKGELVVRMNGAVAIGLQPNRLPPNSGKTK